MKRFRENIRLTPRTSVGKCNCFEAQEILDWCFVLEMHMENHAHGFEKSAISHTLEKATDTKEYHSSK